MLLEVTNKMYKEKVISAINPKTGKLLTNKRRIILFGLTDDEQQVVLKNKPSGNVEIFDATGCATDIIARSCFILIINPDNISEEELDELNGYYCEIDGMYDESIVFTKPNDKINLFDRKIKFTVYEDSRLFCDNVKYSILNALKGSKKNEGFSVQHANAITILSLIRNKKAVSTKQLAEKLEESERTVQRLIESLRLAGEWIEYDRKNKCWTLTAGKSILWGDI